MQARVRRRVQVGVVEALTTVEYEVKLALGDVRGQAADEQRANFFFGVGRGGGIGRGGCSGSGVGFKTRQLGEGHGGKSFGEEER